MAPRSADLRHQPLACTLALALGCGVGPTSPVHPPVPELLDQQDTAVVALVQDLAAEVRGASDDATRWTTLGMAYEANRLFDPARQCYEQAVELDPGMGRSWYRLAMTRAALGDIDGAITAARRTTALDVPYAPAHWRLGSWLVDRGDTAGAAQAFRRASELAPDEPTGPVGLARVSLLDGAPARAAATLERVLSVHPHHNEARMLLDAARRRTGGIGRAMVAMPRRTAPAPADPWTDELAAYRRGASAVRQEAMRRFRSGGFAGAAQLLEELRRDRPDDVSLLVQLGTAYVSGGRADLALPILHDALAREPDHFEVHVALAGAYLGAQAMDRALEHADRAVAISPQHPRGHERRGTLLVRAQRHAEALEAFRLATRFDPLNVTALVSLGMLHYNRDEPSGAFEHFDRARRVDPTVVEAHVGLAMVHMDRGDLEQAEAALQPAARLDPNHPQLVTAAERLRSFRSRSGPSR